MSCVLADGSYQEPGIRVLGRNACHGLKQQFDAFLRVHSAVEEEERRSTF